MANWIAYLAAASLFMGPTSWLLLSGNTVFLSSYIRKIMLGCFSGLTVLSAIFFLFDHSLSWSFPWLKHLSPPYQLEGSMTPLRAKLSLFLILSLGLLALAFHVFCQHKEDHKRFTSFQVLFFLSFLAGISASSHTLLWFGISAMVMTNYFMNNFNYEDSHTNQRAFRIAIIAYSTIFGGLLFAGGAPQKEILFIPILIMFFLYVCAMPLSFWKIKIPGEEAPISPFFYNGLFLLVPLTLYVSDYLLPLSPLSKKVLIGTGMMQMLLALSYLKEESFSSLKSGIVRLTGGIFLIGWVYHVQAQVIWLIISVSVVYNLFEILLQRDKYEEMREMPSLNLFSYRLKATGALCLSLLLMPFFLTLILAEVHAPIQAIFFICFSCASFFMAHHVAILFEKLRSPTELTPSWNKKAFLLIILLGVFVTCIGLELVPMLKSFSISNSTVFIMSLGIILCFALGLISQAYLRRNNKFDSLSCFSSLTIFQKLEDSQYFFYEYLLVRPFKFLSELLSEKVDTFLFEETLLDGFMGVLSGLGKKIEGLRRVSLDHQILVLVLFLVLFLVFFVVV